MKKHLQFVFFLASLLMVGPVQGEEQDSTGPALDPVEHITESITRDEDGNIVRSVKTRKTFLSMSRNVEEVRARGKDGELVLMERKTFTTDLTGSQHNVVKVRNSFGEMVVKNSRSMIVDPDGGTATIERNRNKEGSLIVTRRSTVKGTLKNRVSRDERFDEQGELTAVTERVTTVSKGEGGKDVTVTKSRQNRRNADHILEIVSDTETVAETDADGTTVSITSQRNKAGTIVPASKTTTIRSADGSYLVLTEARDGSGQWFVTNERIVDASHVSTLKIPALNSLHGQKYGPQK